MCKTGSSNQPRVFNDVELREWLCVEVCRDPNSGHYLITIGDWELRAPVEEFERLWGSSLEHGGKALVRIRGCLEVGAVNAL